MKRPKLPGAYKLVEEMGELTQVLMKLAGQAEPDDNLMDLLHEELADVLAATDYLIMSSPKHLDMARLAKRRMAKVQKFVDYDLRGLK